MIHRTIPVCLSVFFCSCWLVHIVCNDGYFFPLLRFCFKYLVTVSQKDSLRAGFKHAQEDPIGFQVQRLNHLAITAVVINNGELVDFIISRSSFQSETGVAVFCDNCSLRRFRMSNPTISQRAGIESARPYSIGFRIQRLIHRANPAHDFLYSFVLVSLSLSLVTMGILFSVPSLLFQVYCQCVTKRFSASRFEPAREDPIGFQVQRLNHSAITAVVFNNGKHVDFNFSRSSFQSETGGAVFCDNCSLRRF